MTWSSTRTSIGTSFARTKTRSSSDPPAITAGSHPTHPREVERLFRAGYRSIVNLAEEGEPGQALSPNVEATWAHTFGLEHARAALGTSATYADVERALESVRTAAKPCYVHSTGGRRAEVIASLAREAAEATRAKARPATFVSRAMEALSRESGTESRVRESRA